MRKIFWEDPYLTRAQSTVTQVYGVEVLLDQTIIYSFAGGQQSDDGTVEGIPVADSEILGGDGSIVYSLKASPSFGPGDSVTCEIDWKKRFQIMKLHSATHIAMAILYDMKGPLPVIGANVTSDKGRVDFRSDEPLTHLVSEMQQRANDIIQQDLEIIEGRSYTLTFTITRTAGTLTTELGDTTGTAYTASESASEVIIAGSGAAIKFKADASYAGTIDDVTIKEVGGTAVFGDVVYFGAADGDTGLVLSREDGPSGLAQDDVFTDATGEIFDHATDDATRKFNFFFVQDETLFGLESPNTFRTTTDPFSETATWAGATKVGDESSNFQGGFVVASVLVIFKEDRVFTVDGSGNVGTLIAQFSENPLVNNFHAFVAAHNSNIYTTVGNELWEYDPVSGALRPLGLATLPDTLLASVTHQPGVTYDDTALYAIHQARLPSAGLSIVRISQDAEGLPTFERLLEATDANSYRPQGPLHADELFTSLTTGRHLFFNTTTAGKIGRMDLFRSGDPTADSLSTYATRNTSLFTGHIDHRFPGQNKNYTEVVLDLTGLSASTPTSKMDVYYYLDGSEAAADRTELVLDLDTSGQHVVPFPAPVTARQMMLEFVFKNATTAVTPALVSWGLWASVDFRLREVITLTARLVDNDAGRGGGTTNKTAEETRQVLRDMRKAENISIKYSDYRGYKFDNVRLLPGWNEQDMIDDKTGLNMTALTFRLMRV